MKAYVIRPTMDVFDGSGALGDRASKALDVIALMVAEALRDGGDTSHQATFWEGVTHISAPPETISLSERDGLIALVRRFLDPNGQTGGDIRSSINCRSVTFGQDGQAMLCLRHGDRAPSSPEPSLARVTEESARLIQTDLFDGTWPGI